MLLGEVLRVYRFLAGFLGTQKQRQRGAYRLFALLEGAMMLLSVCLGFVFGRARAGAWGIMGPL